MPPLALQLRGVSKRYPGMLAVDAVDFDVRPGEVHALLGENGAGKSTLVSLIAGSFSDYTGDAWIDGERVTLHTPAAAKALGIEMIHQELSLAPPLSLAENLLAGQLPAKRGIVDRRALREEAARLLRWVGVDLDPDTRVEEISQPQAQLVEIAKALGANPKILIMDEPTSSLSREEVARLFRLVKELRATGLAVIYISHHLPELAEIADRVTVMRDGKKVDTLEMGEATPERLVEMMVGGVAAALYPKRASAPGAERLRVDDLSRAGFFHNVSFAMRAGEIVGIGGLSGAGRSELARSICRIDPVTRGRIAIDGEPSRAKSYGQAIREGFAYLTEDRKSQGLALRLSVSDNILGGVIGRQSRFGVYSSRRGQGVVREMIAALQVQPPDAAREAGGLSGGNQQKVLLAKWLATKPKVLILDEPTRGVDVAAKAVIHQAIVEAAGQGVAVLLISSDLPELVGLSDQVLILRKGRLIGRLDKTDCSEQAALLAANGQGALSPI
ncbi:putative ribose/galactose/methyl galactoside import ATP-binding protein 3 [Capsulimonas corticalis]|uniref:Ribose/galactose/methyl galactoside import ATP-binding protein 3 n=1 Tax=Capsulimonas corticalis TaxID=2219043 RepID=A0A402D2L0_9BACT|nr:sugar ABC transporter ATP-binding protein [Capsulimonas corticalis]BDI29909.1 putative ribose/galactose/methyl galactoside import ATP-binding protein 3 [Capsulimonas corticalis]